MSYERPTVIRLGSVQGLTLNPPGKQGTSHDSSKFMLNFSCVGKDGQNCGGPK